MSYLGPSPHPAFRTALLVARVSCLESPHTSTTHRLLASASHPGAMSSHPLSSPLGQVASTFRGSSGLVRKKETLGGWDSVGQGVASPTFSSLTGHCSAVSLASDQQLNLLHDLAQASPPPFPMPPDPQPPSSQARCPEALCVLCPRCSPTRLRAAAWRALCVASFCWCVRRDTRDSLAGWGRALPAQRPELHHQLLGAWVRLPVHGVGA